MVRVLCLHGYGTSKDIFRFQLTLLAKACPELDLVFVNAATPSKPAPGIDVFFPDGPYYRFYETVKDGLGRKTFQGLRDGLEHVVRVIEDQGPFDGVIGFSQGANVATMLAAVAEFQRPGLLRFVVCMCGVESGWAETVPDLFPAKLTVPSMHVLARKDGFLEASERLRRLFASPAVENHAGDHRPLPPDRGEALELCRKISAFVKGVVGGGGGGAPS